MLDAYIYVVVNALKSMNSIITITNSDRVDHPAPPWGATAERGQRGTTGA